MEREKLKNLQIEDKENVFEFRGKSSEKLAEAGAPLLDRTNAKNNFPPRIVVPSAPRKKNTLKKNRNFLTNSTSKQNVCSSVTKSNGKRNPYPVSDIFAFHFLQDDHVLEKIHFLEARQHVVSAIFDLHTTNDSFPEVIHLSVHLLDKFLSSKPNNVLLAGLASYRLASKFYDSKSRDWIIESRINSFIDDKYTMGDLNKYEREIFKMNDFKLYEPNPISFLKYFLEILTNLREAQSVYYYSAFIVDLFLFDNLYSQHQKYKIAYAALVISFKILKMDMTILSSLTSYFQNGLPRVRSLEEKMTFLLRIDKNNPNFLLRNKYKKSKNFDVSSKIYSSDFFS